MKLLAVIAVLALGAWQVYEHVDTDQSARPLLAEPTNSSIVAMPTGIVGAGAAASSFQCDGRTHCSQMTSCAEATFFLKSCPSTKMDGNNDGIPCEKQWCKGSW